MSVGTEGGKSFGGTEENWFAGNRRGRQGGMVGEKLEM